MQILAVKLCYLVLEDNLIAEEKGCSLQHLTLPANVQLQNQSGGPPSRAAPIPALPTAPCLQKVIIRENCTVAFTQTPSTGAPPVIGLN